MFGNYTDFNPLFGTDYGICSCIKPQVAFNKSLTHVPYWEKVGEFGSTKGLHTIYHAIWQMIRKFQ